MIADTYLSVSTPVQAAAADLIEQGAAIRAQILARVRRNLESLRRLAAAHPSRERAARRRRMVGRRCRCLQLRAEEALVLELLEKDDVLVHPGYFFDFAREAFVVVSLLVEPATFDQAVTRVLPRAAGATVMRRRQSGISVPLFAIASSRSWGIGEFADLPMFARWLQEAGQSIVQILPINEMPPIETSPYSAMTAMALDPIYITMAERD